MICYQYTNDPVQCPFCNSIENCEHLFALFDETFVSIEGGFLIENNVIEILLTKFFIDVIKVKGFRSNMKKLKNVYISYIWEDIVASKDSYLVDEVFDESDFYLPNYFNYLFDKLDDFVFPEYGEFEGGPGQSSSYKIYYTDNTQAAVEKLKKIVEVDINNFKKLLEIT